MKNAALAALLSALLSLVIACAAPTATPTATSTSAPSACADTVAVPAPASNPGLANDCAALLKSLNTLAGSELLNWSADVPIRRWDGITIGGAPPRVQELNLEGQALTGEIPPQLGNLTGLVELDLGVIQLLTGKIPPELGNLTNLQTLNISVSRLTGEIPPELGNLTGLTE